ncbi:MAG: alpha-L-fucosidase [Sphingobacteriia bacterium]|nr:alpha-L-fucosidase [Sphingobacteriia bacterium]
MNSVYALIVCCGITCNLFAQNPTQKEADRIKIEHAQIGIDDSQVQLYKHTANPGAQWFPQAGFGMFIHWSISSVKELDLSWPMMAGTQIGWSVKKPSQDSINKFIANDDFFAGHRCKVNNTCITPNQYWELAKDFNPKSCNPETWVKLAKEAGMEYVVFTTRHHDGFAMWPSKYGNFNTKNYLGGRDFVKEFVTACRKYGMKIGLYYSGPDWHFNKDYQSFLYYGVGRDYVNIPSIDADHHVRNTAKTEAEKQKHYEDVAAYLKGQVEELLTNYGKIDMIWFDGGPDIPKGNIAREHTITMERIHQLQPGIVVSPRFFGYGDYKTLEGDKSLPTTKQNDWAELCATIADPGWGYTRALLKSTAYVLNQLAVCRSNNTNFLLNFGPTKEGAFSDEMISRLKEIAVWMKSNKPAISGSNALSDDELASVPATASGEHRYLFAMPSVTNKFKTVLPSESLTITFKTGRTVKHIRILGKEEELKYVINNGSVNIEIPSHIRSVNGDVIDIELNKL